jgi:homoprotocatechuate degradation regulator HpaR
MLSENHNADFAPCCTAAARPVRGAVTGAMARKLSGKKPVKSRGSSGQIRHQPASKPGGNPEARRVPMRDFSRSLPMALLRARESVMRHFRPSLRAHGLTEQQWRILRALASTDDIEVTELAHLAYLLGPSLSRILRDLETRRLIQRRVVKADLRRSIVSITAGGLRLIEAVAPSSEAIYSEITRRYGAGKLADLQQALHRLEVRLQAMPVLGGSELEGEAAE